jgi:hypothetical protein
VKNKCVAVALFVFSACAGATLVPAVQIDTLIYSSDVIVVGTLSAGDRFQTTSPRGTLRVVSVVKGPASLLTTPIEVRWTVPAELVRERAQGLWFLTVDQERGGYRATGQTALPAVIVVPGTGVDRPSTVERRLAAILAGTVAADDRSLCDAAGVPDVAVACAAPRRQDAWAELRRLPAAVASEQLLLLAKHPSTEVSLLAVAGLVDLGSTEQVYRVFDRLLHPDEREAVAARVLAAALARNSSAPTLAPTFRKMYESSDRYIRMSALDGLKSAASRDDLALIVSLLDDKDVNTRFMAANTILRISGGHEVSDSRYRQQEDALRKKLKAWAAAQRP